MKELVNFDTENLIIVCYPKNAGGKFLVNCLGLSDQSLFQSADLSVMQLNGLFDYSQKLNYLLTKLDKVDDKWNDLGLGCHQLFGISNSSYRYIVANKIQPQDLTYSPLIGEITNSNSHYFYLVAHSSEVLECHLKVWKNPKIIMLTNFHEFIGTYRSNVWNADAEIKWINTITNVCQPNIVWDTSRYLDKDRLSDGIEELYSVLGFPDYNKEAISTYFEFWINKLLQVKNQQYENRP